MKISSDDILKELQDIWPDYEWEFPTNPDWEPIPDALFDEAIVECSIKGKYIIIPGIWECENFAWEWKAQFHKLQYRWYQSGEYKPQCRNWVQFSTGFTYDFMGNKINHSKIIIRRESGIILFEPQTDEISTDYKSFTPFLGIE